MICSEHNKRLTREVSFPLLAAKNIFTIPTIGKLTLHVSAKCGGDYVFCCHSEVRQ